MSAEDTPQPQVEIHQELSPASPKPLHLLPSSSIPVLEQQMDSALDKTLAESPTQAAVTPDVVAGSDHASTDAAHNLPDLSTTQNGDIAPSTIHGESITHTDDDNTVSQPSSAHDAGPPLAAEPVPMSMSTQPGNEEALPAPTHNEDIPMQDTSDPTIVQSTETSNPEHPQTTAAAETAASDPGTANATVDHGVFQSLLDGLTNTTSASTIHASNNHTATTDGSAGNASSPPIPFQTANGTQPSTVASDYISLNTTVPPHLGHINGSAPAQYPALNIPVQTAAPGTQHAPGTQPAPTFIHAPPPGTVQSSAPARPGLPANPMNGGVGPVNGNAVTAQHDFEHYQQLERDFEQERNWSKFQAGSRIFVGNMPTELATKRDIFQLFCGYGQIVQISLKKAFGFVQFVSADAAARAVLEKNGSKIQGRTINLEICKSQDNKSSAKNANASNSNDRSRRRSRSPDRDRTRNGRTTDRYAPDASPARNSDRSYRPNRSPSPRGYNRSRHDDSRDRYDGRRRSRTPPSRYRDRSPSPRRYDDRRSSSTAATIPYGQIDAAIFVMDRLDRAYVNNVEATMIQSGLRVNTDYLDAQQLRDLNAMMGTYARQAVTAIVQLTRQSQMYSAVDIIVFERSLGTDQVNFERYENIPIQQAAQLINSKKPMPLPRTFPLIPVGSTITAGPGSWRGAAPPASAYGYPPVPAVAPVQPGFAPPPFGINFTAPQGGQRPPSFPPNFPPFPPQGVQQRQGAPVPPPSRAWHPSAAAPAQPDLNEMLRHLDNYKP